MVERVWMFGSTGPEVRVDIGSREVERRLDD